MKTASERAPSRSTAEPIRRILVAYDGSTEAESAWRFAAGLAARTGAHLTVAHATPALGDVLAAPPDPMPGLEGFVRRDEEAWERRLEALGDHVPDGVLAESRVLHGSPARRLLQHAERLSADLLVAGTHGVGMSRSLLGSVSRRLLDHAPCSVLLIRRSFPIAPAVDVLVGVDGSEHARRALAVGQGLAADLGGTLVLVHAADYHVPFASREPSSDVREQLRRHGERLLHDAAGTVVAPLETVKSDLRLGPPRPALLQAAAEHLPAILVVGSRGLHGFKGLLTGSVARDLVDHAPCPVLVVRD